MRLIKNFIKVVLLSAFGLMTICCCVPSKEVIYLLPAVFLVWLFIGAYCYTYKTDPEKMLKKFMES